MKIVLESKANLNEIWEVIESGGLVIFPSETTYGAAVDATNDKAVLKLSKYKQRPLGKPYSVMVKNFEEASKYVEINETAKKIYDNFLPGPVTVVSKGKQRLAKGVEAENGSLGIRIPDYEFLHKFMEVSPMPLTATSANASYKKRPYSVSDVLDNLSDKQKALIDLIIDAGELPHNEPSTVIDTTFDDPVILRQGDKVFSSSNEIVSRTEQETRNFGKEMWQKYEKYSKSRAVVFALEGPMGAGKTQLVKGLGLAMGILEEIISPTFQLEIEYSSNDNSTIKLSHFDAWRLKDNKELELLGVNKLIQEKAVIAIEWADRVEEAIRKWDEEAVIIWIKIEYGKSDNERKIGWRLL